MSHPSTTSNYLEVSTKKVLQVKTTCHLYIENTIWFNPSCSVERGNKYFEKLLKLILKHF